MKRVEWKPPALTFVLERHGGTVMGSTRADRHRWTVDLDRGEADCSSIGYRQVDERDKPLDIKALVAEIVKLIASGSDDTRLTWSPDRCSVRILVEDFVTSKYKQDGRRPTLTIPHDA